MAPWAPPHGASPTLACCVLPLRISMPPLLALLLMLLLLLPREYVAPWLAWVIPLDAPWLSSSG